jgi:hypothetical protein
MGGGSINPTKVHKMLVLSAVEFGSVAYVPARETQLKKLDSIHNKGLRIALGAFWCINRTQNLLIKAGDSTLQQRWEIKTANKAVKITTKPEHTINRHDTWRIRKPNIVSKSYFEWLGFSYSYWKTQFYFYYKIRSRIMMMPIKSFEYTLQWWSTPLLILFEIVLTLHKVYLKIIKWKLV